MAAKRAGLTQALDCMTHTPPTPDKCDFCGLRVFYLDSPPSVDGINSVDADFAKLRQLKDAEIIDAV